MSMIPVTPRSLENELVITFRLNNGLCHSCGTRIFDISTEPATDTRRMIPLTISGIVKEGRCMYCHPDLPNHLIPMVAAGSFQDEGLIENGNRKRNAAVAELCDNLSVDGSLICPNNTHKIIRLNPQESSLISYPFESQAEQKRHEINNEQQKSSNASSANNKRIRTPKKSSPKTNNRKQKSASPLIPLPTIRRFSLDSDEGNENDASTSPGKKSPGPRSKLTADKIVSADVPTDGSRADETPTKKNVQGKKSKIIESKKKKSNILGKESGDSEKKRNYDDRRAEFLADTEAAVEDTNLIPRNKMIVLRDSDNDVYIGVITEGTASKGKAHVKCKRDVRSPDSKSDAGKTSIYKGEFENGYFQGEGYHLDATGCLYRGLFHRGASHGKGTCTWPTGWMYTGEWKNDLREGFGTSRQVMPDGETYSGYWKEDQWHGQGKLIYAGGDTYEGEFFKGNIQGQGTYTFTDKSFYVGTFVQDVRCGYGEMTFADGTMYLGEWKKNWREGKGKFIDVNGHTFEGMYLNDEQVDGILTLTDGTIHDVRKGQVVK